jgi:hypothetical protein
MVRHPIAKTRTNFHANRSRGCRPNRYAHPDAPKPIHPDKEHFCPSTLKLGDRHPLFCVTGLTFSGTGPNRKPKRDFPHKRSTVLLIPCGFDPAVRRRTLTTPNGGDGRNRTDDPLLAKQVLYQLSYIPVILSGPIQTAQRRCCVIGTLRREQIMRPDDEAQSAQSSIRPHRTNGGPGRT